MQQYKQLLIDILNLGTDVSDRTGVGTRCLFGYQSKYNLQDGFPATTTKKLAWRSVVAELLWFLEGSTDERRLAELTYGKPRSELKDKTTIWTANADNQGVALGYINTVDEKELGPVYGKQWRCFGEDCGKDQILELITNIKNTPDSRRLIVSAWDANNISSMTLPPCHVLAQFRVIKGVLSCLMYQRSCDSFLGAPFNIASYALLTHILARECNLQVGDFVHSIGDAHIYKNHFEQVETLLQREPLPLPQLEIADDFNLLDGLKNGFALDTVSKFKLKNYVCHDTITAPMAI